MKLISIVTAILFPVFLFGQLKNNEVPELTKGEPVYLKYIEATITPPEGYIFMEEYSSFLNQLTQTSISVVKDSKMPYQVFVDNMLKKDYTVGNAELLSHEKLNQGYLFTFLFKINNLPVERIVYVTGNERYCVWVSANYKQTEKDKYFEELKKCLISIEY